jgi:hypothetical protein
MRAPVATASAIAVGLIILAGYFFPVPWLQIVRTELIGWAVILAAAAGLVAILNLAAVHWRKSTASKERDIYSIVFLVGFLATLVAGLWLTPSNSNFQQVVLSIQKPVEISLLAMVAISLTYTSVRILARRRGAAGVIFCLSAVVFLILASGLAGFLENVPLLGGIIKAVQILPLAGARGILLGIALGSLVTGIRILTGINRPYSG